MYRVLFENDQFVTNKNSSLVNETRGVAAVRHFRHVPTHNFFTIIKKAKKKLTLFVDERQ